MKPARGIWNEAPDVIGPEVDSDRIKDAVRPQIYVLRALMLPVVPIIALAAMVGGAYTLAWYHRLSPEDKAKKPIQELGKMQVVKGLELVRGFMSKEESQEQIESTAIESEEDFNQTHISARHRIASR
jgi:hypothetical protein